MKFVKYSWQYKTPLVTLVSITSLNNKDYHVYVHCCVKTINHCILLSHNLVIMLSMYNYNHVVLLFVTALLIASKLLIDS